jgi:hypothetical protein
VNEAVKLANYVGEHYGLLPAYAIVISMGALMATGIKHLLFMLSIMAGVYIAMFQAFNLQAKLLPFDVSPLLAGHALPAGVTMDHINKIAALIFVYAVGFAVYGLKRLAVPKEA